MVQLTCDAIIPDGPMKDVEEIENSIRETKIKKRKKQSIPEIKPREIDYELDQKINEYKINTDMDYDEIFQKK